MTKKKILMVCEAFGGGVFTYVSQLCNDMVDDFDVYLAYSLRPQTPKICVFAFSSESVEQLKNDVDEAYSKLQIIDDMGNDMIYDRLVTSEILKWGDGNLR